MRPLTDAQIERRTGKVGVGPTSDRGQLDERTRAFLEDYARFCVRLFLDGLAPTGTDPSEPG